MKLSELGEFGLIDLLARTVDSNRDSSAKSWQQLEIGIGDDTAAWRVCDSSIQLATVDSLVQDVHFSPDITPLGKLGWKALAINLSDIAAMGGSPEYALVALTLPAGTPVEDVADFYRGLLEAARAFGVAIVGGNVSRGAVTSITVTVTGRAAAAERLLRRSTARPGQRIAVTGVLGSAAAGLEILRGRASPEPPARSRLVGAFLRPVPRVDEGKLLVEHGIRTGTDISDGLLADLGHICDASGVDARIEADRVPLDLAVKALFKDKALGLGLAGGEDYELLFTGEADAIGALSQAASCLVTVIGEVLERPGKSRRITVVDREGKALDIAGEGWQHF